MKQRNSTVGRLHHRWLPLYICIACSLQGWPTCKLFSVTRLFFYYISLSLCYRNQIISWLITLNAQISRNSYDEERTTNPFISAVIDLATYNNVYSRAFCETTPCRVIGLTYTTGYKVNLVNFQSIAFYKQIYCPGIGSEVCRKVLITMNQLTTQQQTWSVGPRAVSWRRCWSHNSQ